ncbi:DUF421 domain-containing protein [Bacillus sp. V5-8f]|uniref:DUF421 domain-containing protein n=1 Tax=Bacillus sp. V5-8f TaxID=2053044 RepID=UPI0015E073AC|nr:DUF421 domain-containing protein [Bacillus sp. V5-8f]
MSGTTEIIIRTITAFLSLWIFVQILGKQTIAHRSYHLYIASITVGTIAGNLAFNIRIKFHYFIVSLLIISLTVFFLNAILMKHRLYRKWIAGEPEVLIENGAIQEEKMRKIGYTLDMLNQALREKDMFDIHEVDYAILETNGVLSVLKKPKFRNVTKSDLQIDTSSEKMFPVELVIEREILEENTRHKEYNKQWLMAELNKRSLELSDVCYAVVGTNGQLYLDLYNDSQAGLHDA